MKRILSFSASVLVISACQSAPSITTISDLPPHMARVVEIAHEPQNPYILIEAHRGSLSLERPENSRPAIEHAIEIGVDWIELDVALTKDNRLVLMHDKTLDRTTTLSGAVEDYTIAEIMSANLKQDDGVVTDLNPPSLEEALDQMAGRILFRLDLKCGAICVRQVYDMVEAKGLMNHAVLNERLRLRALASGLSDDQIIVVGEKIEDIGSPDLIPEGVDYVQVKDFDAANPPVQLMQTFEPDVRMVVYPYDDRRSGGRGDERSALDPDAGWGWLAEIGGDIFLTDEAEPSMRYLEANGFRLK